MTALEELELSIHCWQGDDVGGFESPDAKLEGGGIQVTGNYPGKARNSAELRGDMVKLFDLLPGKHRINLHASYGEFGGKIVERDKIEKKHFAGWVSWAREQSVKLDFNATYFSHPLADSGFTLSSKEKSIRDFWIDHSKCCREIAAYFGREQGSPCVNNIWIPDGTKDFPVDRGGHRAILVEVLDEIFRDEFPESELQDAVEAKLFGIGSEAYVVGSHEFYLGYAVSRKKVLCVDMGHFHPTELVADKISSILPFVEKMLLHISRPMRWDSDHVVLFDDNVRFLAEELVRCGRIRDIYLGLDFFDASINRVGAWAIGSRATLQALLFAFLEPHKKLVEYEVSGNNFARLALLEQVKAMPFGAVWDHYCTTHDVPTQSRIIEEILGYEEKVLSRRN